ncbi:MAG: hypothetical protein JSW67_09370 [Candidatus Latescibacterota bacterium]|nr:MAG: hypothetical protein JSW67_09370 [Candidatus Latescibacterota bacterium]
MPKSKDFKRLVRSRMQKTGESYTTARTQILEKKKRKSVSAPAITASSAELARLAGMSDEAVRAKTGRTWTQWLRVLDAIDATAMSHRDIARHLREAHEISGWWAQTVTVGYERIRGLREVGQRRGGAYEMNKSKTLHVPLAKLYRAFSTARTRNRWLPGVKPQIRKATPEKSMRMTWEDGSSVQAYFTARGEQKSQVAIQHAGLPTRSAANSMREYWGERLGALADLLGSSTAGGKRKQR